MKKPSERIREIYVSNKIRDANEYRGEELGDIWAILDYLDEEWTKEHNHEIGTNCNKCS